MVAEVEARLKISAQDRTAKAFTDIESRLKRSERLAKLINNRERAEARASVFHRKEAALQRREEALARASGTGGMIAAMGGRLVPALAAVASVTAVAGAIKSYAELERRMTRIGLAAGASAEETKAATGEVSNLSYSLALPFDQAVSGLDALIATGKSMPEALAFLPSILRTAQASGAATEDMAQSANALATSLKVPASEMQAAFDALVVGGQLGQFELKDMARYLPSLTASAAKLGFVGQDGVERLVAMLQTVRQVSGTSEEAATAVRDAFEKVLSPTVATNFKKRGVDIGKVLVDAGRRGENQFDAVLNVVDKLTKGMSDTQRNLFLSSIFTDAESRRAIAALTTLRDKNEEYRTALKKSAGATDQNLGRVLADSQASVDRLSSSFERLTNAVGRSADALGASWLMDKLAAGGNAVADSVDETKAIQAGVDKALEGKSWWEQRQILMRFGGTPEDIISLARKGGYLPREEREQARRSAEEAAAVPAIPGGAPLPPVNPLRVPAAGQPSGPLPLTDPRASLLARLPNTDVEHAFAPPPGAVTPLAEVTGAQSGDLLDKLGAALRTLVEGYGGIIEPHRAPSALSPPTVAPSSVSNAGPLAIQGDESVVGALREAMEAAGPPIQSAGDAAAASITQAAQALDSAAGRIGEEGRRAAEALSAVRISVPTYAATPRGGANANLGQSMPTAGTPGG